MSPDSMNLQDFLYTPINHEMINYLCDLTSQLINCPANQSVSLPNFIRRLVARSNIQTPTLMATAVYLQRLQMLFPMGVTGMETTLHRTFLGCLIIVSKFVNDKSPSNKYWCLYTEGLFTLEEVNAIERELLNIFKWDIVFDESHLYEAWRPLLKKRPYILRSTSSASSLSTAESIFEHNEDFQNPYDIPLSESLSLEKISSAKSNSSMSKQSSISTTTTAWRQTTNKLSQLFKRRMGV